MLNTKYTNWKCNAYHIYGDNSKKEYGYDDLKEYFNITGDTITECKKDFVGNAKKLEFYSFKKGDLAYVDKTCDGFCIRKVV